MNDAALNAIDADATALASAGALTADALALHRDALALLTEGWDSESGSTAADLIRRQCGDAAELVAALHGAAAEFRSLRDTFEEASVPHTEPDTAAAHPDQNYAQTAARLNDRPQPSFEAPAVPPTSPPTPTAWPSGAMSVPVPVPVPVSMPRPGIGGALVSLIAQAADALSADAVDSSQPVDPVVTADPAKEVTASPHRSTVAPTPLPPLATPAPANDSVPQPDPPPQPQLQPQLQPEPQPRAEPQLQPQVEPEPKPEPPLLAAERPAQAETPAAEVTDARTPCEIAVDELPQVGQ